MKLKKGDIIIAFILVIALGFWIYNNYISNATNVENLVIEVNGKIFKKIPVSELKEEKHIHIDLENNRHMNIIANESGTWVEDVVCPDKLCQKTGVINKVGQSIVCLPNKIVIYYEGEKDSQIDAVSH